MRRRPGGEENARAVGRDREGSHREVLALCQRFRVAVRFHGRIERLAPEVRVVAFLAEHRVVAVGLFTRFRPVVVLGACQEVEARPFGAKRRLRAPSAPSSFQFEGFAAGDAQHVDRAVAREQQPAAVRRPFVVAYGLLPASQLDRLTAVHRSDPELFDLSVFLEVVAEILPCDARAGRRDLGVPHDRHVEEGVEERGSRFVGGAVEAIASRAADRSRRVMRPPWH